MSDRFEFLPDAALGIEHVLVRGLGITVVGTIKEKITIEISESAPQVALYDRFNKIRETIKGARIWVNSAKILVLFVPDEGKEKGRQRTFDISWPRSSSLNNNGKDLYIQQMLSATGIEPREPEDTSND